MTVRNRAGVRETVGSRTAGTRPTALRALGYARVSTHQQADGGAGLEAQRVAVVGEAERRGWHLVELIEDAGQSSATPTTMADATWSDPGYGGRSTCWSSRWRTCCWSRSWTG